jgi:hypothetical protein
MSHAFPRNEAEKEILGCFNTLRNTTVTVENGDTLVFSMVLANLMELLNTATDKVNAKLQLPVFVVVENKVCLQWGHLPPWVLDMSKPVTVKLEKQD